MGYMYNPKRIIYKYNNLNKRVRYQLYVFLGPKTPTNIIKILKDFENLNLYDTLKKVNKNDVKELENFYEYKENWYMHFFPFLHVENTIQLVSKSVSKQKELISKFGKSWYDNFMKKSATARKMYSYSFLYKNEITNKAREKKTEI